MRPRVGQWVYLNAGFNNLKTTPTYFNYNSPYIKRNTLFLYQLRSSCLWFNYDDNCLIAPYNYNTIICAFSRITFITLSAYFPIFRILFGISINKYDFYLSYLANTEKGTEFWTNISSSCRDMSLGLYNVHYT